MLIVKKMPILQGFPDFETVKNLSGNAAEDVNFSPLFYDIETTGLGPNSSFLYLIGAVCYVIWFLAAISVACTRFPGRKSIIGGFFRIYKKFQLYHPIQWRFF